MKQLATSSMEVADGLSPKLTLSVGLRARHKATSKMAQIISKDAR
jgi:hypothetical protein